MTQALVRLFKQERSFHRSKCDTEFNSGRNRGRPVKLKHSENRIMNYPPSKQPKSSRASKVCESRSAAAARAWEKKNVVTPTTTESLLPKKSKRRDQPIVDDSQSEPPNGSRNGSRNKSRNGSLNKSRNEFRDKPQKEFTDEFHHRSRKEFRDEIQDESREEMFQKMLERKVPDLMQNELGDAEYTDIGVYEGVLAQKKVCCDTCSDETAEDSKKISPKRKTREKNCHIFCAACGKSFGGNGTLRAHYQRAHSPQGPLDDLVEQCGQRRWKESVSSGYVSLSYLMNHEGRKTSH